MNIQLKEIEPGLLIDAQQFTISAFPVVHRGPDCYGFLFQEKPRRPFLNHSAEELNVPFGPQRRQLVQGHPITLADGRTIQPEQVLGDEIPGTRLAHIGDVGRTEELRPVLRGVDALVIESTYLDVEADLAKKFNHLTARQAAQLASDLDINNLILTHLSRRYRERDMLAEAQSIFPQAVIARDFDHYQIRRNQQLIQKKSFPQK